MRLATGMHLSVVCAEDVPRLALGGRQAGQPTSAPPSPRFYERLCAAWPRGAVPAAFYSLPTSAVAGAAC